MAQRSSNLVLAGAAAGHGSVTVLGECHYSRCASKLISCFVQGGLALLNAASDAFVAAPTPAAAPSLRGSNAAIAQAPHDMTALPNRVHEDLPDPCQLEPLGTNCTFKRFACHRLRRCSGCGCRCSSANRWDADVLDR